MAYDYKLSGHLKNTGSDKENKGRTLTLFVLLVLSIIFLAWFDDGEEPLRSIEQTVAVPGSN